MRRKICLFTAHSPLGGGGSVILRSMVESLEEFSITWKYVADAPAKGYEDGFMGKSFMGGSIVNDFVQSYRMLGDLPSKKIDEIVNVLLSIECDSYWIISHNEGIRVALELSRLQKSRPVHLTIHDDWAGALSARSIRYRPLAGIADKLTAKTLNSVAHFDVISIGMKDYYYQLSGREGEVCHRFLKKEAIALHETDKEFPELHVGHIGSIYSKEDFLVFAETVKKFAEKKGKIAIINMWGYHLDQSQVPEHLRETIKFHGNLTEKEAIDKLSHCAFVYAMYPMSKRMRKFSQTSLPTKLSSYVQAYRPILGHGPSDSTLAEFLTTTSTGILWDSNNTGKGNEVLEKIYNLRLQPENWENARSQYFGDKNLEVMRRSLSNPNA